MAAVLGRTEDVLRVAPSCQDQTWSGVDHLLNLVRHHLVPRGVVFGSLGPPDICRAPAEIDENGNVKLLKELPVSSSRRALVTILDEGEQISETALLSEPALAVDWNRPEEDVAWSHLRLAQ